MSEQKRLKWKMIKQILKSDNCILVSLDSDEFDYKFAGKSLMFAQLFQRLNTFIPNWYKQWAHKNAVD